MNQHETQLPVAVSFFTAIIEQVPCTPERKLELKAQLQQLCDAIRVAPQEYPPAPGYHVPDWARSNGPKPVPLKQFPSRRKHCRIFEGGLADKKQMDALNRQDRDADQQTQCRDALFLRLSEKQARDNAKVMAAHPNHIVQGTVASWRLVINDNCVLTGLVEIHSQAKPDLPPLLLPFDQEDLYRHMVGPGDIITISQIPGQRASITAKVPSSRKYILRTKCPVCGHNTTEIPQNNKARCINPNCYAVLVNGLHRIGSKHGMVGMPFTRPQLAAMARECLVQTQADLFQRIDADFYQTVQRICPECRDIDPVGTAIAMNLCKNRLTLAKLIFCLNIPGVQEITAEQLAREFGSLSQLMKATECDLKSYAAAYGIRKFFQKPANRKMINQYIALGLNCPS